MASTKYDVPFVDLLENLLLDYGFPTKFVIYTISYVFLMLGNIYAIYVLWSIRSRNYLFRITMKVIALLNSCFLLLKVPLVVFKYLSFVEHSFPASVDYIFISTKTVVQLFLSVFVMGLLCVDLDPSQVFFGLPCTSFFICYVSLKIVPLMERTIEFFGLTSVVHFTTAGSTEREQAYHILEHAILVSIAVILFGIFATLWFRQHQPGGEDVITTSVYAAVIWKLIFLYYTLEIQTLVTGPLLNLYRGLLNGQHEYAFLKMGNSIHVR